METSSQIFKSAIDKAYTTQPNVKINKNTMGDALKYKSSFTEEKDNNFSKNNQKEMVDGIVNIVKKVKDINNRMSIAKDMINKFKRENIKTDYNKFMKDCGLSDTKMIETKEVNDNQYKYETFLEKNKRKRCRHGSFLKISTVVITISLINSLFSIFVNFILG